MTPRRVSVKFLKQSKTHKKTTSGFDITTSGFTFSRVIRFYRRYNHVLAEGIVRSSVLMMLSAFCLRQLNCLFTPLTCMMIQVLRNCGKLYLQAFSINNHFLRSACLQICVSLERPWQSFSPLLGATAAYYTRLESPFHAQHFIC